jgi:hypothetical protein
MTNHREDRLAYKALETIGYALQLDKSVQFRLTSSI